MNLFGFDIHELPFGGDATAIQQRGQTTALVRELGDNYAAYHERLAGELARVGRPVAPEHADAKAALAGYDAFVGEWTYVEQLVAGEAVLRICRAHRVDGARLVSTLPPGPVLVQDDRLVAYDDPQVPAPGAAP